MREISIFADESGDKTANSRFFLLTVVFHDQSNPIQPYLDAYRRSLTIAELPDIPYHSEPLMNGHKEYAHLDLSKRKKLLVSFNVLVQRLPIHYRTLSFKSSRLDSESNLAAHIKRGLVELFSENLEYFQTFDKVKIYYDNGQRMVQNAISEAVLDSISKHAIQHRRMTMSEYRLAQVADYLCAIELAALKYATKENSATYDKMFGSYGSFKRNWLKQARRKLFTGDPSSTRTCGSSHRRSR